MVAIIIAVILVFILHLAFWEGVVLGIAWLIGEVADIGVNYPFIGGIVLGVWALVLAVKVLFVIGTYREQKKIDAEFDARFKRLSEQRKRMFDR